ncbi:MAG: hypothetical protein HC866_21190 [Leptolyngbyaceae cyanobacterium RU_5_1]|nr:hypothetical protein [Leptolyngbyaceae cyanobacterium RU_5_1]
MRDNRIEQRRNYTDACVEKQADQDGIAKGTNKIYDNLWGDRPDGKRDNWTVDQQKEIAVGENIAANHVRSSSKTGNDAVVEASSEGAKQAREYIDDQKENGNWWGRLF